MVDKITFATISVETFCTLKLGNLEKKAMMEYYVLQLRVIERIRILSRLSALNGQ